MTAKDLSDDSIRELYKRAVHHFDNAVFVELGSLCGASAVYLAKEIREQQKNIIVYCVDLWMDDKMSFFSEFWRTVVEHGAEDIIRPIQADSAEAAKVFKDHSIDFVFIDADHDLIPVTRDITYWLPKLKDHAWMGGHDYDYHVYKAVQRLFGEKAEKIGHTCWLMQFEVAK